MLTRYIRLKADTDGLPYVYRDNTDNDIAHITYLPDAPVIEGELNYQQQLTAMHMRRLVRTIIGRSTLLTPISPAATGVSNEIRLHTADTMFHAAINGIVKTVYAYDEPVSSSKVEGGNRVKLPDYVSSGRKDLVYLEIWFEEVMNPTAQGTADTTIYRYGMTHGFTDPNNIKVTSYGELRETTRRVQLRGKIKTLSGVETLVGATAKDTTAFTYSDAGGYMRAGTGDVSSAQNLNSVDGYAYAIPLVKVTRGANAATMSAIEVVAPSTATLQQLASSTLKDVAQFGADIANLQNLAASNANRVTQLETDNSTLKQANTSLLSQLTSANNKIATLEKSNKIIKRTFRMDTRDITRWDANYQPITAGFSAGNWYPNQYATEIPANYKVQIGEVRASMQAANIGFVVRLTTSRANAPVKIWTWTPKISNGNTYYLNVSGGWVLQREGENMYVDVPELEHTSAQYMVISLGVNIPTAMNFLQLFSFGEIELIFSPK